MTNNLHAHMDTYSTDCDGSYTRSWVEGMNPREEASEYGDIEFQERISGSVVNTYSLLFSGSLQVTRDGEDGQVSLYWSEATDEGGISRQVRFCENEECDVEKSLYRDHSAEAAGY